MWRPTGNVLLFYLIDVFLYGDQQVMCYYFTSYMYSCVETNRYYVTILPHRCIPVWRPTGNVLLFYLIYVFLCGDQQVLCYYFTSYMYSCVETNRYYVAILPHRCIPVWRPTGNVLLFYLIYVFLCGDQQVLCYYFTS